MILSSSAINADFDIESDFNPIVSSEFVFTMMSARHLCRSVSRGSHSLFRIHRGAPSLGSIRLQSAQASEEKIDLPSSGENKTYPEKIVRIVDDISKLNLLEVSELNSLLKSKLNISDAPVMMAAGAGPVAAQASGDDEDEGEGASAAAIQTSFTLKLTGFDAAKKVALIKELKNQVEGMNLVQAKKFVEGAPDVVKSEIGKDEAEKIKKALEEAGGTCVIE